MPYIPKKPTLYVIKVILEEMATTTTSHIEKSLSQLPLIVTWVDPGIGEAGMHKYTKDRFENLSQLISQWLYFDNPDTFTRYVEDNSNIRLISVMSGGMSRLLVPKLSHHAILESVYVFCADIDLARQALANENKVKGIFNIEDDLYDQMADDLAKLFLQDGIHLAQQDQRSLAKVKYEEAKRLLTSHAQRIEQNERRERLEELDGRIDQLLA